MRLGTRPARPPPTSTHGRRGPVPRPPPAPGCPGSGVPAADPDAGQAGAAQDGGVDAGCGCRRPPGCSITPASRGQSSVAELRPLGEHHHRLGALAPPRTGRRSAPSIAAHRPGPSPRVGTAPGRSRPARRPACRSSAATAERRRVPQVVGAGLERQPEQAQPPPASEPVPRRRSPPCGSCRPSAGAAGCWCRSSRAAAGTRSPPRPRPAAARACPSAGTSRPTPGPGDRNACPIRLS